MPLQQSPADPVQDVNKDMTCSRKCRSSCIHRVYAGYADQFRDYWYLQRCPARSLTKMQLLLLQRTCQSRSIVMQPCSTIVFRDQGQVPHSLPLPVCWIDHCWKADELSPNLCMSCPHGKIAADSLACLQGCQSKRLTLQSLQAGQRTLCSCSGGSCVGGTRVIRLLDLLSQNKWPASSSRPY